MLDSYLRCSASSARYFPLELVGYIIGFFLVLLFRCFDIPFPLATKNASVKNAKLIARCASALLTFLPLSFVPETYVIYYSEH